MKKAIVGILIAGMTAALISGCGGSTADTSQSTQSASAESSETNDSESTAVSESSETAEEKTQVRYIVRQTEKSADGTLLNEYRYDENHRFLWSITTSSYNTTDRVYYVQVNDYSFNEAGELTEQKMYRSNQLESAEGINPEDFKADEYLVNTTAYIYDENGNCTEEIDTYNSGDIASSNSTKMVYDENGRLTTRIQESGDTIYTTEYTYDEQGRQIESIETNSADPEDVRKSEYVYDEQNQLVKWIDSHTNEYSAVTDYTVDPEGHASYRTVSTDSEGKETITEGIYIGKGYNIVLQGTDWKDNSGPVDFTSEVQFDDNGNSGSFIRKYADGTTFEKTFELDENGYLIRETITNIEGSYMYAEEGSVIEYEYAAVTEE